MCCGKMVRFPGKKERIILTTGNISINLDKTGGTNDNNKRNKRKFKQGQT